MNGTARGRFMLIGPVVVLLAAVGIYGAMSYSVEECTQEFGIRMALGAQRSDVLRLVLRDGMKLAGLGIAIGLSGAFMMTPLVTAICSRRDWG